MTIHTEPTQTPQLPPPPFGTEVDLRRFATMPIDVQLLRDSEFVVFTGAEEFRAHVLLLCAAWHRVPAGSLPNDDRFLAVLAKVSPKTWGKIKNGALSGFIQHSDERLYHPVLTAAVLKSYAVLDANRNRTLAATASRKQRDVDRHDEENDQRDVDRNVNQRKGKEKKGDERNREEPPQPQADGGGALQNSSEIGLGDMLAGIAGFEDRSLLGSLNLAAKGASHQQLDRAAAAIIAGCGQAKDLAAYSISIAKKAAVGMVTEAAQPTVTIQPAPWADKNGWSIQTQKFGLLTIEFGLLRSKNGILHPDASAIVADALASGELTIQPQAPAVST